MKSGESITSARIDLHSKYPCYGGNGLRGFTTRYTHDGRFALIGRQGALCGNVLGVEGRSFASEHAIVVTASAQTDKITGRSSMRFCLTLLMRVAALVFLSVPSFAALANDLSCTAPKTPSDCIVNGNRDLQSLVEGMNIAYEERRAHLDKNTRTAFEDDQTHWDTTLSIACGLPSSGVVASEQIPHAISCLSEHYRTRIADLEQRCELGKATLEEMEKLPDQLFPTIPADFKLDNKIQSFMLREPTSAHYLPSEGSKVLYGLRIPYIATMPRAGHIPPWLALCRAQDTDGQWWFVRGEWGISLTYVAEGPAEQTDTYEAEAKKSIEELELRRKQNHSNDK